MGTAKRLRTRGQLHTRSANDRLKDRWGSYLSGSIAMAATAHLMVFALWPHHELQLRPPPAREVVQLIPVSSTTALPENASAQPAMPVEEAPIVPDPSVEPDVFDRWQAPAPTLAYATDVAVRRPPGPRMLLSAVEPAAPHSDLTIPGFTWPAIQNPSAIQRFLRSRFNPLHLPGRVGRAVAVGMWISSGGVVEWTEVDQSSGHDEMDRIAMEVFDRVVEFAPARMEGRPVPVFVVISVPFDLPW
jgi:TonB family protein